MPGRFVIRRIFVLAAANLLLSAAEISAQTLGPKNEPAAMSSDYQPLLWRDNDAQFALDVSRAARCQIAADQLVGSRSADDEILSTAAHSISFEDQSNNKLKSMARTIGFQLGSKKHPPECADVERLRILRGEAFDHAYAAVLSQNSRKGQALFANEAGAAPNSANYELRKFAAQRLAKLRESQKAIDTLLSRYDSSSRHSQ